MAKNDSATELSCASPRRSIDTGTPACSQRVRNTDTVYPVVLGALRRRVMTLIRAGRLWLLLVVVGVLACGMLAADPLPSVGLDGAVGVGGFADDDGSVHESAIDALSAGGVLEGTECGEGLFCPGEPILRWVVAVWLVRALGDQLAVGAGTRFADVDPDEWWAPYVETLAGLGVTAGCHTGPLRFCPDEVVTRAQMASFLVHAFDLGPAPSAGFTDTSGSVHVSSIDALAAGRMTAGCATSPLRYCPDVPVTRGQMATFLARATGLVSLPPDSDAVGEGTVVTDLRELNQRFIDVAVGYEHACAVRSDGRVTCWGNDQDVSVRGRSLVRGRTQPPDGSFKAVAAAIDGSCGIRIDGSLSCWGRMSTPEGRYESVSGNYWHMCAVATSGGVVCWGNDEYGQASPPEGTFSAVAAGARHSCALGSDGEVACWGSDEYGQASPPEGAFSAVAAGARHSCAVRLDQSVVCWGSNESNQSDAPDGEFETVVAGNEHSCALAIDRSMFCWGQPGESATWKPSGRFRLIAGGTDGYCALRTDETIVCWGNYSRPIINTDAPSSSWVEVTTRGSVRCVRRTDGIVVCWEEGTNLLHGSPMRVFRDGTLSTHDALNLTVRSQDGLDVTYRDVDSYTSVVCGLKADNTVACWGVPSFGRLDVPAGEFKSVTVGRLHSCGLRFDGTVECWGISTGEPLILQSKWQHWIAGLGSHDDYEGQFDVPVGRYTAIAAGSEHTCGIMTDKSIACWGRARDIEGTPSGQFRRVAAGFGDTCAIRDNGSLVCWGKRLSRVDLPTGEYMDLDVSYAAACGIRTDGRIVCWSSSTGPGISGSARLTYLNAPTGTFKKVTQDSRRACAIHTDGSLECWNLYGTYDPETYPGQFLTLSRGGLCAVRTDGSVTCRGNNAYGVLEIPFEPAKPSPENMIDGAGGGELSTPSDAHTTITASNEFTCALRADRTISCWGGAIAYQRPPGDDRWSGYPGEFYPGIPTGQFLSISGGESYACGIRLDKTIACWGANYRGELDAPSGEFKTISAGYEHACGVRTDGTIACWGAWGFVSRSEIVEPPPGKYVGVSAGHNYSCGIRTDRSIICWGLPGHDEYAEELLDAPAGEFSAVSTGPLHACGLHTDRTITCWSRGERPDQADADYPVIYNWGQLDVPGGQYVSVDVAQDYSCGLRIDGVTVCWGYGPASSRVAGDFISIAVGHAHLCGVRADGTVDCVGFRGCRGFADRGQFDAPPELFLT